jgi:heat shock protein HtpX
MVYFQYIIHGCTLDSRRYFSDKIVLWTSGAKIVSKEEHPRLHEIVERLSANNGLPKPKVAMVNSMVPNAFATGKGPKNSGCSNFRDFRPFG